MPHHFSQLLEATAGTATGVAVDDFAFERVCTDSRTLRRGEVFWALSGPRHDGHHFIAEAYRKGAAACVIQRGHTATLTGPAIEVDDTLRALADFARWYRHQCEALIVGVTGSVGKTTTREMINTVLSARHSGMRSRGNYNNEVGLPLSLLDLQTDDEFGVIEMGASRPGDIRTLCEIACPEVGVITKVGLAHLETFGTAEQILNTKGELVESLPPHGFAVLGGDDERVRGLADRAICPTILVGESAGNQVRATDVEVKPRRLRFTVDRKRYEVPAVGRHLLLSALCAVAVAREIGMEPSAIAAGLLKFNAEKGRCHVEDCGDWTVIDDTYNANPTSMAAACACLHDWPEDRRKLIVLGDMLELGPEAAKFHRQLGECVAQSGLDHLLAIGDYADDVADGALAAGMKAFRIADCQDLESLLTVLDCWLEPQDIVLVKGSRGMRMERVVEWIKQRSGGQTEVQARALTRAVA